MKKIVLYTTYSLVFNLTLLIFLFISIQNSNNKKRVNLIFIESIDLPISFIIGSSFIMGSLVGNVIYSLIDIKKINNKNYLSER